MLRKINVATQSYKAIYSLVPSTLRVFIYEIQKEGLTLVRLTRSETYDPSLAPHSMDFPNLNEIYFTKEEANAFF